MIQGCKSFVPIFQTYSLYYFLINVNLEKFSWFLQCSPLYCCLIAQNHIADQDHKDLNHCFKLYSTTGTNVVNFSPFILRIQNIYYEPVQTGYFLRVIKYNMYLMSSSLWNLVYDQLLLRLAVYGRCYFANCCISQGVCINHRVEVA